MSVCDFAQFKLLVLVFPIWHLLWFSPYGLLLLFLVWLARIWEHTYNNSKNPFKHRHHLSVGNNHIQLVAGINFDTKSWYEKRISSVINFNSFTGRARIIALPPILQHKSAPYSLLWLSVDAPLCCPVWVKWLLTIYFTFFSLSLFLFHNSQSNVYYLNIHARKNLSISRPLSHSTNT